MDGQLLKQLNCVPCSASCVSTKHIEIIECSLFRVPDETRICNTLILKSVSVFRVFPLKGGVWRGTRRAPTLSLQGFSGPLLWSFLLKNWDHQRERKRSVIVRNDAAEMLG